MEAEIVLNKANTLVMRTNRFFGTARKSMPYRYSKQTMNRLDMDYSANITASYVDTVSARFEIANLLKSQSKNPKTSVREKPYYRIDFGNSRYSGQVLLSTVGTLKQPKSEKYTSHGNLPFITDEYGYTLKASEWQTIHPSAHWPKH